MKSEIEKLKVDLKKAQEQASGAEHKKTIE
jgi:hypothetical protein